MKKENSCTKNLRPIGDTLEVVGGKWKLMILSAFVNGETRRFRELQRELGTITPRMLSKELKDLEMHQLIERKVYDTSPPVVEYQISEYGKTLDSVMIALRDWGIKHRERIIFDDRVRNEAMAG
jgi:DNA-binding HxlR family transcriptional regulator